MSAQPPKHVTCEHLFSIHNGKDPENREHVIIDMRERSEFESGHIEGSHHVPHREMENVESLVPEKSQKVIVVLGPTQEKEMEKINAQLHEMGYGNAEFLAGGIDSWCEIADVELGDVLNGDTTPEERGMVDPEHSSQIDPDNGNNDPLY